jgi:hypothetical protein
MWMSKEIAEKEGFVIGEKVLCFGIVGYKRMVTIEMISDVKYGGDDETVHIFLSGKAGYYSSDEIITKKKIFDAFAEQV